MLKGGQRILLLSLLSFRARIGNWLREVTDEALGGWLEGGPKRGSGKLAGLLPGSRIVGSDLRISHRFWSDHELLGSNARKVAKVAWKDCGLSTILLCNTFSLKSYN
jgi:hypothetical protein